MTEENFSTPEKIGYVLGQMTVTLINAGFYWLVWQVFVFVDFPAVPFAAFVFIEAVSQLIANHLNEKVEGN